MKKMQKPGTSGVYANFLSQKWGCEQLKKYESNVNNFYNNFIYFTLSFSYLLN